MLQATLSTAMLASRTGLCFVQEEDMIVFKATVISAKGRPTQQHFQSVAVQLQEPLPEHLRCTRSAEHVCERFRLLNKCFQEHCNQQKSC